MAFISQFKMYPESTYDIKDSYPHKVIITPDIEVLKEFSRIVNDTAISSAIPLSQMIFSAEHFNPVYFDELDKKLEVKHNSLIIASIKESGDLIYLETKYDGVSYTSTIFSMGIFEDYIEVYDSDKDALALLIHNTKLTEPAMSLLKERLFTGASKE